MTCGGIVAVVAAAAAVVAVDAEIMIDQNVGVPILLAPYFSIVAIPLSLDHDFLRIETAAAVPADHLLPGAPFLQIQHQPSHLELIEIAAAGGHWVLQRTVALAADCVGN